MHVHVLEDARARRLAEIDPDIDAVRRVGLDERLLAERLQVGHLVPLDVRQRRQRGRVPVRHDQQMPVVIRIEIEDDETGFPFVDDEGIRMRRTGCVAEDAPRIGFAAGHVLKSPGRPEMIQPSHFSYSASDVAAVHQSHPGNTFRRGFDPSRNRRQRSSHEHGGRQ